MYDIVTLNIRGKHEAVGHSDLSHTAASGLHPNKVPTSTVALQTTERTIEPQTIHTMPLPSCSRRSESPILIFKKAIEKPLMRTAKFENFRAATASAGSSVMIDFPYP